MDRKRGMLGTVWQRLKEGASLCREKWLRLEQPTCSFRIWGKFFAKGTDQASFAALISEICLS